MVTRCDDEKSHKKEEKEAGERAKNTECMTSTQKELKT